MQIQPKQCGRWYRKLDQIATIQDHANSLFGCAFPAASLNPPPQPEFPKCQRLQGRCFARVVWSNEDNGRTEFDVRFLEPFEIPNNQARNHFASFKPFVTSNSFS